MANYELLISELKSGRFMQTVVARRVKKSMGLSCLRADQASLTSCGREYSRVFGS
ncbi:unnamed protein product [Brassica oleracea]